MKLAQTFSFNAKVLETFTTWIHFYTDKVFQSKVLTENVVWKPSKELEKNAHKQNFVEYKHKNVGTYGTVF